VTAAALTYRLDLPRWDVGPRVPYRTKSGKIRTRMKRAVWDALTGNARNAHWSQRSKAVTQVVEAVWWTAKAAKIPPASHLTVQLVWAPGDQRRADPPNLASLQKPCVDALVRLGLVPDDTATWVTELMPRIDRPPVPAGLWLEVTARV
jgi:hypothetical protein